MSRSFHTRPGGVCQGAIVVPGDKSISHRALMFGALASGRTVVEGLLESGDCLATRDALRAMGARIERAEAGVWHIDGVGERGLQPAAGPVDCGNSGTGMRLLAGLLAGQNVAVELIGDSSLMGRPMGRVARPLAAMGALVDTGPDGRPPLRIRPAGRLRAGHHRTEVASAQVKSAILLAGLGAGGQTCVTEPAPTRDHTERLLPAFGCPVDTDGLTACVNGPAALRGTRIHVPADPSSAAFFAVAASLLPGSDLLLPNVGVNPRRTGFLDVLLRMGARIERSDERLIGAEPVADLRVRSAALHGIDVPPDWVPRTIDEFPVLFIAAAAASGTTRVRGAAELRVKESDRLAAMAAGLGALGIGTRLHADGIDIDGGAFGSGEIDSFGDHRIAMAFAVAGALASGPLRIRGVENVATSFPGFAALAGQAGWQVDERNDDE